VALPLAGCGKKAPPSVPSGEVNTFPRAYPKPVPPSPADQADASAKPDDGAKPPQ
jgi:hypothetical protein